MSSPKFSSLLLCLALFFSACSGSKSDAPSAKKNDLPANSLFLEALSATSVKLPASQYGPENLFDNDPSTIWATMPGAAPDEGVMLRFATPLFINSIELKKPNQSSFLEISRVQLYVDGQETALKSLNAPIPIGRAIKSLFIRITELAKTPSNQALFSSNNSTALSDLVLYDKNNQPLPIYPPRIVPGNITPSSALSPQEAYQADFLFDSRLDFGWADGNSEKTGIGEFLDIHTPEAITITKLKIWNGYQRSDTHYTSNERIKTFSFGSEASSATYTLPDSPSAQEVQLKAPLTATDFKLAVTDIYPGSKYKDLVISELRFFDGKNWFILSSGKLEKDKQELLKKAQNSLLGGILDRRFYQDKPNPDVSGQTSVQSLILRSNGSFVLWKFAYNEESSSNDTEKIVADGNWQIIQLSETAATIRIFGRLHQIKTSETTSYNPYAGEKEEASQSESTKIFQDTLDISSSTLTSQKKLFVPFQYKATK